MPLKITCKGLCFIFSILVLLSGCKPVEEGDRNCKIVLESLDKCVEQRTTPQACHIAVENLELSLINTTVKPYNQRSWANDCRRLCQSTYDYRPIVRRNYESICINSEIFSIKDDRFIKLAALSSVWAIGLLVLLGGIKKARKVRRFLKACITTKGIVVGHETTRSDGSTLYAPVIEFRDMLGRTHTFTSSVYTSRMGKPGNAINSTVKVLYPEGKPEEARFDSFMTLWMLPSFLVVWGGGMAMVCGFALFGQAEWRSHYGYLQQHAPAIADTANEIVEYARNKVFVITSVRDYRIIDAQPDAVYIEADYLLSPFKDGNVFMGAISMTDGKSGGQWGYRPARLETGFGKARVRLSMNSKAGDYCSNQIQLSIYEAGKGSFYTRTLPYEKCWSKHSP